MILPEVGGVPAALEALAREGTAYFADMNYDSEVHLSLPKFSLSYGGSLMDGLKAQGMQIATGADADFSAMCANAPLYISNVIQNVRIDVDEKGTSAAAVTCLLYTSFIPERICRPGRRVWHDLGGVYRWRICRRCAG